MGRRGYHHGNLREALIRAALELIVEKGPSGFTFAEAARSAGVSAAAPYRHFRDRDELIADVARQGFERFEAMLKAAWADGRPDPLTGLESIGKAYLGFARTQPAYYAAMFESGLTLDGYPDLLQAGDRTFALLRGAADAVVGDLEPRPSPPGGHAGAPCLVLGPRHRRPLQPRRRRPSQAADVARGAPGGRPARLSGRARAATGSADSVNPDLDIDLDASHVRECN